MEQNHKRITLVLLVLSLFAYASIGHATTTVFTQIINAQVGHYPPSSESVTYQDVEINGAYAYVSDASLPGLRVISLVDPSNPSLTASSAVTVATSYEIEIANNIAFLRVMENQDYDIEYIDITTPSTPVYKNLLDLNHARGFDAVGYVLYVNNGTEVITFNITDVDDIKELYRLDLTDYGQSLAFIDDTIYVCTSSNQLKLINATDPSDLILISTLNLNDFYVDSYLINGDILYASGFDGTKTVLPERAHRGYVIAIDISNQSDPTPFTELFIDGINGVGLALHDNKLFVGACAEGIEVIDISNPSVLEATGYYDDYQDLYCGGEHYALYPKHYVDATLGDLIVFVSSSCGLNIIKADGFEFEFSIPGFEVYTLTFSTILGLSFIFVKLRRRLKSS